MHDLRYEVVGDIVDKEGIYFLFLGGLGIKIVSNTIQAMLFAVIWKYLLGLWNGGKVPSFSIAVPANYASQALNAVGGMYLFFGAFLMNFPDELMAQYGISIRSVLPDSTAMLQYQFPVKMFWAAYGVSMVTVAMVLGAVSRCGDRATQSLVCLGFTVSAVVQILDTLFLSGSVALSEPINATPGMVYFNAALLSVLAVSTYLGWRSSGAELPNVRHSQPTTLANTLRVNIILFALYGFGLTMNRDGMYKAYMKVRAPLHPSVCVWNRCARMWVVVLLRVLVLRLWVVVLLRVLVLRLWVVVLLRVLVLRSCPRRERSEQTFSAAAAPPCGVVSEARHMMPDDLRRKHVCVRSPIWHEAC
jgi:hypothetical protein